MTEAVSVDRGVQELLDVRAGETAFQRKPSQAAKCKFGQQGLCCRLCANGPCRITEKGPRGVCGADADTMVARGFLRTVAAGAACYLHVVENTATALKDAAGGKPGRAIRDEAKLRRASAGLGVSVGSRPASVLADELATKVLGDLYKPRQQPMDLVSKLAPPSALDLWKSLNLIPGGAKAEVFDALVKTSTNLNSDPVDMLMHCLRLGICTGYYGLVLTNTLNDILLGSPEIAAVPAGLGTIAGDTLNVAVTGHQHAMLDRAFQFLMENGLEQEALKAGAAGVRVIGLTCVGQDMQSRTDRVKGYFSGHAGDNFTSEAAVASGAVDLILSDFNCTLPGLAPLAQAQGIPTVCLDDVAKLPGATPLAPYASGAAETARQLIKQAVRCFGAKPKRLPKFPRQPQTALSGLTEDSLVRFLGGNLKPLLGLIAEGKIKGIAGVVGCSNLMGKGHGFLTVDLTRELIARDILVLTAGCTSGVLGNTGMLAPEAAEQAGPKLGPVCKSLGIPPVLNFGPCLGIGRVEMVAQAVADALGVKVSQLPVVVSAPEWLEEQAFADGAFALALGLTVHLGQAPPITGSPLVTGVLTDKLRGITGGMVVVDDDAQRAADRLEAVVIEKRKALSLS